VPPADKYLVFHNYYHFKQQLLESVSIDRKTGMSVVATLLSFTGARGNGEFRAVSCPSPEIPE